MSSILTLLFLAAVACFGIAIFKPTFFHRFGKTFPRKHLLGSFGLAAFVFLMAVGATSPPTTNTSAKSAPPQTTHAQSQKTTKQVNVTKPVAFTTQNENDGSLPQGQTQTKQAGVNGVETITYQVTYINGKETGRTQISDKVTTAPVPQIVDVGTYVAPAPTASSSGGSYVNSDGNTVESPDSNSASATALCNDGTYSHSQHHSGTCSGHGGVAQWLD